MDRIAVLGLGTMGLPMARNLLKAGYAVTVWNRTPQKGAPLAAEGATVAATPREAAAKADVIITMLTDVPAVEAAALGPDGLLAGARPGAVWVDCSTIGLEAARRFASLAEEAGLGWLDAPVGGSMLQAQGAQLRFLVGGEEAVLQRVRPVLERLGQQVTHCGPAGHGAAAKLVNNLFFAIALAALGEARALGQHLGLAPDVLDQILRNSPASGPFVPGKLPVIESGCYEPAHFALHLMEKDLGLALAEVAFGPLPVSGAAYAAYGGARAAGLGHLDVSAVARYAELLLHKDRQ